ncbi:MAG: SDR family NAD(P)-dependent oxidoreductase, partial [Myxococcota bacterium]|nr:SDR family NAD(P)-dependent oxidoreductase [Myxococcota bacterium]
SEEHIIQLKLSILQYTDRLDGIINNAGVGLGGPVELLNVDDIRTLFDINVLGHIKMTQVFLPLLRKAEQGRVVFTGSVAGFLSLPLQSPYAASKFALRAFCDALRVELRSQNIRVSLIQPGMIKTPIWSKSPLAGIEEHPQADRYRTSIQKSYALLRDGAKSSASVSIVIKAMNHALFSPFPKAKYLVGHDARLAYCARILPTFLFDLILIRFYL